MTPAEFLAAILDFRNKFATDSNATTDPAELIHLGENYIADLETALTAAGNELSSPGPRIQA